MYFSFACWMAISLCFSSLQFFSSILNWGVAVHLTHLLTKYLIRHRVSTSYQYVYSWWWLWSSILSGSFNLKVRALICFKPQHRSKDHWKLSLAALVKVQVMKRSWSPAGNLLVMISGSLGNQTHDKKPQGW